MYFVPKNATKNILYHIFLSGLFAWVEKAEINQFHRNDFLSYDDPAILLSSQNTHSSSRLQVPMAL